MLEKFDFSLKRRVIGIGGLHVVACLYSLFEAIFSIIEEERPLTDADIFYMCLQVAIHAFLISTLILGATTGNALLLLPWLIVTFPVFVSVSYFTLKYSRFSYFSQFTFNIFFICLGWYLWFTVLVFCRKCKNSVHRTEKE